MTKSNTLAIKSQAGPKSGGRTRLYATVVYPESAPDNWLELLSETHVAAFVSPLHDRDINPDGAQKKPHYHVLLNFDGVKTAEQAETVFRSFGGVGRELVNSYRGYARYLCHLDNPEKAQYDPEDVKAFGGADYHAAVDLPSDRYASIAEMMSYCDDNNIVSFAQLARVSREFHPDWFRCLCDNSAVFMKEFLRSKQWEETL